MQQLIINFSKDRKKSASREIRAELIQKKASGEIQNVPSKRSIKRCLQDASLPWLRTTSHKGKLLILTPWHARHRLQFANYVLDSRKRYGRTKINGEKIWKYLSFGDEKKFCLWDSRGGYRKHGDDPNIARRNGWTDEEYLAWESSWKDTAQLADQTGRTLPKKKIAGKSCSKSTILRRSETRTSNEEFCAPPSILLR